MERQALRLAHMVEEMLTAAKLERSESMPLLRRVDLAALIRMSALDSQVAGRPVELDGARALRGAGRSRSRCGASSATSSRTRTSTARRRCGSCSIRTATRSCCRSSTRAPGVPPAEREKIFDRFYRSDTNGEKPGVGLGLPIVRGLVEACGGSVWVEDAPGGGAAFRVASADARG